MPRWLQLGGPLFESNYRIGEMRTGKMAKKLYVYDKSSSLDKKQAAGRFDGVSDVVTVPAASIAELKSSLDQMAGLVKFDRAVFQTHGSPGTIYFKDDALTSYRLLTEFAGRGYTSLFAAGSRLYFDGCNVGEGEAGEKFLAAAGKIFLAAGGEAFAWETLGVAIPGWLPGWLSGGHTIHLGPLKKLRFDNSGNVIPAPIPPLAMSIDDFRGRE